MSVTATPGFRIVASAADLAIAEFVEGEDITFSLDPVQLGPDHFKCPITGESYRRGEGVRVSVGGLRQLVDNGIAFWALATRHSLPHNLVVSQMSSSLVIGPAPTRRVGHYWCSPDGAQQLIQAYARIGGWFKVAADYPIVRRLLVKTQSYKGTGSHRTTVSLDRLIDKFPSPGGLERKLKAVRKRAEAILAAYEGDLVPAWHAIANALLVDARVGKAAIIAVALTVSGGTEWFWSYREARNFLVAVRTARFVATVEVDGTIVRIDPEVLAERDGYVLYAARVPRGEHGAVSVSSWFIRTPDGSGFLRSMCYEPADDLRLTIEQIDYYRGKSEA